MLRDIHRQIKSYFSIEETLNFLIFITPRINFKFEVLERRIREIFDRIATSKMVKNEIEFKFIKYLYDSHYGDYERNVLENLLQSYLNSSR